MVFVSNPRSADAIQNALDEGRSVIPVLGKQPVRVTRETITRVVARKSENDIRIFYWQEKQGNNVVVTLPGPSAKEEALDGLESALGLRRTVKTYSALRAAATPLALWFVCAQLARRWVMSREDLTAEFIDTVSGFSRLALGAAIFWWWRRAKNPPVVTMLDPPWPSESDGGASP